MYARTSSTTTTAATKTLLTSSGATVYLNMNNSRNVVVASIVGQDPDTQGAEIVFHARGSRTGTTPGTTPVTTPVTPRNVISIVPSSTTGEPGEEITLSVTSDPTSRFVSLGSVSLPAANFSPTAGITPFTSTLLLPDEERTHTISGSSAGLTTGSAL